MYSISYYYQVGKFEEYTILVHPCMFALSVCFWLLVLIALLPNLIVYLLQNSPALKAQFKAEVKVVHSHITDFYL